MAKFRTLGGVERMSVRPPLATTRSRLGGELGDNIASSSIGQAYPVPSVREYSYARNDALADSSDFAVSLSSRPTFPLLGPSNGRSFSTPPVFVSPSHYYSPTPLDLVPSRLLRSLAKMHSHHSHSGQFCRHAKDQLEDVVQEAIRQGFTTFGLSEHAPRYREQDLFPEEVRSAT